MSFKRARTGEQFKQRRDDIVSSAISIYNEHGEQWKKCIIKGK